MSEAARAATSGSSLQLLCLLLCRLAYADCLPFLVHLTVCAAIEPLHSCDGSLATSTLAITLTVLIETFIVLI